VDAASLTEPQRARHAQKQHQHTETLRLCEEAGRANVVRTSPAAGYMQFPDGSYGPGHRVSAVAAGNRVRLVVAALVGPEGSDQGRLGPALTEARAQLHTAGVPPGQRLQAAADAGYWCEEDLAFAADNVAWVDVLVRDLGEKGPNANKPEVYGRKDFHLEEAARTVVCPAGRPMHSPLKPPADDTWRYVGEGCGDCAQRARCTRGQGPRTLYIRWAFERGKRLMRERMDRPGATERYHQRMGCIEPVFSSLEDALGFRRVSSRHPRTVPAEVMLKLLAHNVARLLRHSPRARTPDGAEAPALRAA
jgi:hypothetical protein